MEMGIEIRSTASSLQSHIEESPLQSSEFSESESNSIVVEKMNLERNDRHFLLKNLNSIRVMLREEVYKAYACVYHYHP